MLNFSLGFYLDPILRVNLKFRELENESFSISTVADRSNFSILSDLDFTIFSEPHSTIFIDLNFSIFTDNNYTIFGDLNFR